MSNVTLPTLRSSARHRLQARCTDTKSCPFAVEAFTAAKEKERRRNVEIITADREYDPSQQGGYADGYKPKVGRILQILSTRAGRCCLLLRATIAAAAAARATAQER